MNQVQFFKGQIVKLKELIPNHRYRIISANAIDTKYGDSILCRFRDDKSRTDDQDVNIFLPRR